MTDPRPAVHVCIATGQNAANFIPLQQYGAQEIWILQTPAMQDSARHLATALKDEARHIERIDFDDSDPRSIEASAHRVAERLDGREVVLHATGGTKLMVLALRDGLRLVETGSGKLDILYADTSRQRIDWLGSQPRSEPMAEVLDITRMLLVQGYRIDNDTRHAAAQQRAAARAALTREMGDKAAQYGSAFSVLATLASQACDAKGEGGLTQPLHHAPSRPLAELLDKAQSQGMLQRDGVRSITFADSSAAAYLAGGWLEEFVLLKLTGLARPGRFGSNIRLFSADERVPNEIDAMLVHRNRALFIECKTGRQTKPQDALYKLAQLRQRLGGSVAGALYLSAQSVGEEALKRAREYGVQVLAAEEVGRLVPWMRDWMAR